MLLYVGQFLNTLFTDMNLITKNSPYLAGFAAFLWLAGFASKNDVLAMVSFVLGAIILLTCFVHEVIKARKKTKELKDQKDASHIFSTRKHDWFISGISLVWAALSYNYYGKKLAIIFLVLSAFALIGFVSFLINNSRNK